MERKTYFKERSSEEIRNLKISLIYQQMGLVQRIDDIDSSIEALDIRTYLIPANFRRGDISSVESSKKAYKHGRLIALPQPKNLSEALSRENLRPLDMRSQAFSWLRFDEENIFYIGYSWRPVMGRNRTKRVVPFVSLPEGARIFSYAENNSVYRQRNKKTQKMETKRGIKVDDYYDSKRVREEGASVVVEIPSRSEKESKYKFGLLHVPYIPNVPLGKNFNLASILSLEPAIVRTEDGEILKGRTPHQDYDIRYTFEESREQSPLIRFSPQDVAAYLGVIKKQLTEEHNMTALTFNPFALPSRHQAEFYKKLCNNVLIFDPTLSSKDKRRKLHLAEKSILLARAIKIFGHTNFAYWDPTRDGIYKDFDWEISS